MRLYDEVQRQKTLLDSVFAESPTGIAVIDPAGRIIQSNQELAAFLDTPLDTIRDQLLPDLIAAGNGDAALITTLRNGLRGSIPFHIDEVTLDPNTVRIDLAPLHAYDLWIVMIGDMTAVVELSKLKTQMLRLASHDLKNPLSRVMGFAELLEMVGTLDEEQQRFLNHIKHGADEMLNIINDILNLERLRSGKLALEEIDLTRLTSEVCASHQPDTIQKKQQFEVNLPDQPIHANADTGQLSEAISNLVGNAIKYTPDGGRVTVRLSEEDNLIRFEVEDTGYGISREAQDKLFTEFYRAKSKATEHIGGTGLGLSLVKSVVEAHGGAVGFTSTEGVGSTFYFTLPGIDQSASKQIP